MSIDVVHVLHLFDDHVVSVLGGIKSLQNNERFLGIKSSIESVTMSVRETLVESWGITDEIDDVYDVDTTAKSEGHQAGIEGDVRNDQLDGTVAEQTVLGQKNGADTSSIEFNTDEGCDI